jgi:hypothetical protein
MSSLSHQSGNELQTTVPRQPLGTLIFRKGLLTAEQLLEALEEGNRTHRRLGEILVQRGWLNEEELARTLAEQYGLPWVDLAPMDVDREAALALSPEDARRLGAVVIRLEDGVPVAALSDPSDGSLLSELVKLLGNRIRLVVTTPSRVAEALDGAADVPALRFASHVPADSEMLQAADETEVSSAPEPGRSEDAALGEPAAVDAESMPVEPELPAVWPPAPEPAHVASVEPAEEREPAADWPSPFESASVPEVEGLEEDAFGEPAAESLLSDEAPALDAESLVAGELDEVELDEVEEPAIPSAWASAFEPPAEPVEAAQLGEPSEEAPSTVWPPPFEEAAVASAEPAPEFSEHHDDHFGDEETVFDAAPGHDAFVPAEPVVFELERAEPADASALAPDEAAPSSEMSAAEPMLPPEPADEPAPQDFDEFAQAPAAYQVAPWPEALASSEHATTSESPAANGDAPPPVAVEAVLEPAPVVVAADEASDAAADVPELQPPTEPQPVVLVLRLNTREQVELGRFDDPSLARARAAEIVEQLIDDERNGWTAIDGRYFRPEAIVAVDVAPAG